LDLYLLSEDNWTREFTRSRGDRFLPIFGLPKTRGIVFASCHSCK
jgi:hypothetical protein